MLSDSERQTAAQIRETLSQELAAVAGNGDLAIDARYRLMAQAVVTARRSMRELRAQSDARMKGEAERAYAAIFGFKGNAAEERAYRADLAARQPNADQALAEFELARLRGDRTSMVGLVEYAYTNRHSVDGDFVEVLNRYGAMSADNDQRMLNLLAFSEQPDRGEQLEDKLLTEVAVPGALRSAGNLEALAAETQQPASPPGMSWAQADRPDGASHPWAS